MAYDKVPFFLFDLHKTCGRLPGSSMTKSDIDPSHSNSLSHKYLAELFFPTDQSEQNALHDLTQLSTGFSPSPRSMYFGPLLILSKYWELKEALEHGAIPIFCSTVPSHHLLIPFPHMLFFLSLFALPFLPDLWDAHRSYHGSILPIAIVYLPYIVVIFWDNSPLT